MQLDPERSCPHCGRSEVFRSHQRGTVEWCLLHIIGVRPLRCGNCDARIDRLKHADGTESQAVRAA